MAQWIALPRGINVSGQKLVRMRALEASCAALGWRDVRTYLQSGNVVFATPKASVAQSAAKARALATELRARIAADFRHDVAVLVLPAPELDRLTRCNPLLARNDVQQDALYVTFLFSALDGVRFRELELPTRPGEEAHLVEQAIFLRCPRGYGASKINNAFFERKLQVTATTRNWRTVLALRALCQED